MKLHEIMESSKPLPEAVIKAFEKLGNDQRGTPERIMVQAQHIMGGGVLNHAIEHVGDLTHRMTHMMGWSPSNDGHEYVSKKCESVLRSLNSGYGFEREFRENMKNNNADMEQVTAILKKYADAHYALTVYNDLQWHARQAAVHLGRMQFSMATSMLESIDWVVSDRARYAEAAREYELDQQGNPKPYKS